MRQNLTALIDSSSWSRNSLLLCIPAIHHRAQISPLLVSFITIIYNRNNIMLLFICIMASSGMLGRVALVRADVSEEHSASSIRLTRIGELGTTLAVTNNRRTLHRLLVTASVVPSSPILITLMKEALSSSEMSVLTRGTLRNTPEDAILHSRRCGNFKSYNIHVVCCTSVCT
jgi:hypothetical protein